MATHLEAGHNTYSSSGEDSGDEELPRKCNYFYRHFDNDVCDATERMYYFLCFF